MLAFDPDSGRFEDAVDLTLATGRPATAGVYSAGLNRAAVLVYDAPMDFDMLASEFADPRAYLSQEFWRWGFLDLASESTVLFEDLPLSSLSFPPALVDDAIHLGIALESEGTSDLFRLDDASATRLLSTSGEILNTLRIR